jgi:uncharacterized protein YdhG (YjbR/CyaY superfamily)
LCGVRFTGGHRAADFWRLSRDTKVLKPRERLGNVIRSFCPTEPNYVRCFVLKTIAEYIASFPPNIQTVLEELRQAIRESAPNAEEVISYQMPAFKLNGILVYFAAFKNHVGFFPTASGIEAFRRELSPYKQGKGSAQFPLDKPIPFDLVKKIVKFRVKENESKKKK